MVLDPRADLVLAADLPAHTGTRLLAGSVTDPVRIDRSPDRTDGLCVLIAAASTTCRLSASRRSIGFSLSLESLPATLGIRIPTVYGLKLHGSAQQVNHRNRWRSWTRIHHSGVSTDDSTDHPTDHQRHFRTPRRCRIRRPPAVRPARVAVVGIHGHGSTHVRNALALQQNGTCQLVAVADLRATRCRRRRS